MRYLVLLAAFGLANGALAGEPPKTLSKPLDKSSPVLTSAQPAADTPDDATEATNRAEQAPQASPRGRLHAEGVVHRDVATRSAGTRAQDYNSSRSNNSSRRSDATGDPPAGTRAQDYNSSRSNNSSRRSDATGDLDGDGRPDVVVCTRGVDDDCDGAESSDSATNHNSRRSNRR